MEKQATGVIGLGNMGGRIAGRILAAGYDVIGFDTRPGLAEQLGAAPAQSASAVVEAADVILLSLPDSATVESVILGDNAHGPGILDACRDGHVVVDLSTASPESTRRLHARLAERKVEFVDAGISGGASAAERGTLSIMAGGSKQVIEQLGWLFDTFSAQVYHMGESGTGHTTKLLNNFLNGVSLAATAEVMVAARKAGLDLTQFLDVLNHSSGVNFATLNRFPRIVQGDYLEGGLTGNLMMKDLALYVDLARALGTPCLNASGPVAAFGLADSLGYGDQISNRVVDALGDVAGGVRLHE